MTAERIATVAGPAGIGHRVRAGSRSALCGVRTPDVRWSYSPKRACADCAAVELWHVTPAEVSR